MQSKATRGPSLEFIVGVLQASVALTVPRTSLIVPKEGLQKSVILVIVPAEKVGGVISNVQFTVLDTVDILPHPSFAVNVLVFDLRQLLL